MNLSRRPPKPCFTLFSELLIFHFCTKSGPANNINYARLLIIQVLNYRDFTLLFSCLSVSLVFITHDHFSYPDPQLLKKDTSISFFPLKSIRLQSFNLSISTIKIHLPVFFITHISSITKFILTIDDISSLFIYHVVWESTKGDKRNIVSRCSQVCQERSIELSGSPPTQKERELSWSGSGVTPMMPSSIQIGDTKVRKYSTHVFLSNLARIINLLPSIKVAPIPHATFPLALDLIYSSSMLSPSTSLLCSDPSSLSFSPVSSAGGSALLHQSHGTVPTWHCPTH